MRAFDDIVETLFDYWHEAGLQPLQPPDNSIEVSCLADVCEIENSERLSIKLQVARCNYSADEWLNAMQQALPRNADQVEWDKC